MKGDQALLFEHEVEKLLQNVFASDEALEDALDKLEKEYSGASA